MWSRRHFLSRIGSAGVLAAVPPRLRARPAFPPHDARARTVRWADLGQLAGRVEALGVTAQGFDAAVERIHDENLRRVREGDLDHLVFYMLQSSRFTALAPIEPALSAQAVVAGLSTADREVFLRTGRSDAVHVPAAVHARIAALTGAAAPAAPARDARLFYFRDLIATIGADRTAREAALGREYLRAMRFL